MKIEITTQCEFHIALTARHVDCLIKLASHHYDSQCKAAVGVFLIGWKRSIETLQDIPGKHRITMSWNQCDTCLKLLEMRQYLKGTDLRRADELNRALAGALSLANLKYSEWRATYES